MLDVSDSVVPPWPLQISDWVDALERPFFTIGARKVTLEVQGMDEERDHCWIQVASAANSTLTMLLHIFPGANIRDAVRSLLMLGHRNRWPTTLDVHGKG